MSSLTLFSIFITVVIYIGAKLLSMRVLSPFTTPVFSATIVIITILSFMDISYEAYTPAKDIMTFMLGPATVALAVPLYHNRVVIREKLLPAITGIVVGTVATVASAILLSWVVGGSETVQAAAAVKAVTTPVAIELTHILGGDATLAAAFVITAGMFGAILGPTILNVVRLKDEFSRGLAIGTVSHGIGTSQAAIEGRLQGAVSSVAMAMAAILTSLLLPLVYPLFTL
ncbi:LrgB family protein [Bacillus sp. HMF5848]|uniref:LrgB family protein n=1 Tax=Bacillus sp. HMF5848 TaxID=2495421 RepID=UPI000F78EFBF|nr:LrgB family protein [Bacillus sp. HMF5848]RSK25927.1 LrgB family protein [Bacillus sp. HMF5848]